MKHPMVGKLLCVAVAALVVAPLGWMVLPYFDARITGFEFNALEAVISAMVGVGLYGALFG